MVFDDEKQELNNRLLAVCTADVIDFELAEELLRQGAEPMGKIVNCYGEDDNLYTAVLDHLFNNEDTLLDAYRITELFSRYGMDISKPAIPYDYDEEVRNPLTMFSYPDGEYVLKALEVLLDNGLSAEDAQECWLKEICDYTDVWGELQSEGTMEMYCDYLRKLILIASYPHIIETDELLRKEIWYDYNHYDLTRFRKWNEFDFDVDTSHCDRIPEVPEVYKSIVTIKEKETGNPVWTFGVCLTPDDL